MAWPLVSVVIPTYNRAHTLARSVESVLQQTYRTLEVIVVDDGSTDNTLDVLKPFGNQIKIIRQSNTGPSSARNKGVAHSKGEIIAFIDSDDTWKPEKLERQIRLLANAGSQVPCCVCNAETMADGRKGKSSFDIAGVMSGIDEGYWLNPADLIATRFLLFNQVVAIRRSAFQKTGGFKESIRILEDHDLAFRLSLLGPWGFISETLVNKYEESDGIGVQARQTAGIHAAAWKKVLEGFLQEAIDGRHTVQAHIRRALNDVAIEIRILALGDGVVARISMLLLRIKKAICRRLSSWPKPESVAKLDSISLAEE